MTYKKYSFRDLEEQDAYMWSMTTFESVLETIRNRSIVPVIQRYMEQSGRILEAGCGNGAWIHFLNDLGYRAVGLDINAKIISDGTGRVPMVRNDVLTKCFANDTFDACLSLGVVEHFSEGPHAPLAEARRVIKPGGYLFVSTPCNNLIRKLLNHPLRDIVNLFQRFRGKKLHFVEYRFDRHELVEHVRQAGFDIVETVPNDYRLDQNERSIGFYTDWPMLRSSSDEKWLLNVPGRLIFRLLKMFSPHWVSSGILVVARKVE